ncbi:proprotein convertase P-domain-containing protein, partial [Moorena sp. SIO3B2]|uniref:proprotein convertase P-domain-containing protein n=1 Tax=Moorena sp. SIO3B2 TaxID=2607827 RepID=UPI0013CC7717
ASWKGKAGTRVVGSKVQTENSPKRFPIHPRCLLKQTYSVETTPGLKSVLNKPASGVWQLQVVDDVAMDTGRLNSWELILGVG